VNENRYNRIKELLSKVINLPEEDRENYLDEACKDDPELRREIELILEHKADQLEILKTGGAITESVILESGAGKTDLFIGRTVGRYRILSLIGQGGMGTVYQAEDESLQRTVALKFLPIEYYFDEQSKTRFIAEAQTIAVLDHPNICTVYEIGESGGQSFIAMAFVQGESVREKISRGPLKIKEVMNIAIQVGEGLQHAHDRGVVHRDIKPSNLMVTDDGLVKILDFGIARSAERARITRTGSTLGTIAYMSPEQAMGEKIDHRTDIWSLGVTLYEMITGRLPFEREQAQTVIYAIQHEEPEPISALRSDVRVELEQIVSKCMQKNPDFRYQTGGGFVADVRYLQERMKTSSVRPTASGVLQSGQKSKWLSWVKVSAIVSLAVLAVFLITRYQDFLNEPFHAKNSFQVTSTSAMATEPAISPDGGRIAYTSNSSGNLDIYLIDARGGQSVQITDDHADDYDPAWFPDGSAIVFTSERSGSQAIWKIGQLGGNAIQYLPNAHHPAISPDGKWITYTRMNADGNLRVGIAPLSDLSKTRPITDDEDGIWHHRYPAWSPDGRFISYSAQENIWVVSIEDGQTRPITLDGNYHLHTTWSPDGKYIYFSSEREGTKALWSVPVRGGEPERLTMGTGFESHPSITGDGLRIAYTTEFVNHDIISLDTQSGQEWRLAGPYYESMPSIIPDKRGIVFASGRMDGRSEIWYLPLLPAIDSAEPLRITDHQGNSSHPVVSPDGKWIAYYRILGAQRDIWTIPLSGGPSNQLTTNKSMDIHPTWSPDGGSIAFVSDRSGENQIWLMDIQDGKRMGEPTQLSQGEISAIAPVWSPDGKQIAYIGHKEDQLDVWTTLVEPRSTPERITRGTRPIRVRWDSSGSTLIVSGMWGSNNVTLREINLQSGEILVPDYDVDFGWRSGEGCFDISSDGAFITYTRVETHGEIWILEAD
jgi:Tol biopolymer transport system component